MTPLQPATPSIRELGMSGRTDGQQAMLVLLQTFRRSPPRGWGQGGVTAGTRGPCWGSLW